MHELYRIEGVKFAVQLKKDLGAFFITLIHKTTLIHELDTRQYNTNTT